MDRLCCLMILCIGCGPGDITGGTGGPPGDDVADAPDAGDLGPDGGGAADCVPAATNLGSGHHNPGTACIACHLGNGGPDFTIAGTLYTSAAGGTALAGGTIIVTDADGTTIQLASQTNGNFYTTQALTFPVTVSASRCPDSAAMSASVTEGDCNTGGCHVAGSATGRIHLP